MNSDDLLASLSHVSDETEFFTPMPAGYEPGKTKYVVVFGRGKVPHYAGNVTWEKRSLVTELV